MRKGFTLIELLAVLAIAGILLALLVAGIAAARSRSRMEKTRAEIREMQKAVKEFCSLYQRPPISAMGESPVDSTIVAVLGGRDLVGNPNGVKLMDFAPEDEAEGFKDPWGNEYRFSVTQQEFTRRSTFKAVACLMNRERY